MKLDLTASRQVPPGQVPGGQVPPGQVPDGQVPEGQVPESALRISFDDISFSRYRVIFKISLKYRYRIFLENITRYLIIKY